ncbi:MAG: response regulator [Acidobacteria bacterium]|nr:response regulator [Acidobacteriota bacterium]
MHLAVEEEAGTFPRERRRTAGTAPPPLTERRRSSSSPPDACALVVEDDPHLNEAICFLLKSDGFRPVGVFNGAEALEILHRKADPLPAVILADLAMPVMNGWEFRARLEAEGRLSRIPLLVLSTFVDNDVNTSGDRPELQLAKPFGAEMLLLCVNRLVGARSGSGRARLFENLACRLSADHANVSFLLDEEDKLPLFCLQASRFEARIVREISSGSVRASLGAPEAGGFRRLVLSRTWGGAQISSTLERVRVDGEA